MVQFEGQNFPGGAKQFRLTLHKYSLVTGHTFKFLKNDDYRVTAIYGRSIVSGCSWKVHASARFNLPDFFFLKEYVSVHTCGGGLIDITKPNLSKKLVKELILSDVKDNPSVRPSLVLRAKGFALREIYGKEESSYMELLWYTDALRRTNPGSHIVLEVDPATKVFKRIFICFRACIFGVRYCRPVIFLDGTFLKTKFKGCSMGATTKNGNQEFYLFAFVVVGSEDNVNYDWFLENLKSILVPERDLTFISDRQHRILVGVENVFLMHIMGGEKVRKFIDVIPLKCWANLYFKGQRYGEITLELAESFNGWIKFECTLPVTLMVDTIRITMMKMMSERRENCRSWKGLLCPKIEKLIATNFEVERTWDLTKSYDFVYEVHSDPSHRVDLMNWFCTCTEWQLRGIPCPHVVCAIQRSGTPIFQFVNSYYSVVNYLNAYLHPIGPIPNYDKPNIDPKSLAILPPTVKPGPGRPRKKKIESAWNNNEKVKERIEVAGINDKKAKKRVEGAENIDKKAQRCGRCKQLCLHNSRICTAILD
ncbi:zinc finger protein [Macleaya cordata]|uniref:Zinc finger protein n=1 Tax=Macleaya cordata TaxID=56857 RepID=A0A200Q6J8_MACCD|nr:zinc finger protein [Macleaya cordata]